MPTPRASTLQTQLKRALRALDAEISRTPLDANLQRALTEMYLQRDDDLGRLLAAVGNKAHLLDSARTRAAWMARQPPAAGATTSASLISHAFADQEQFTDLDADLSQPIAHGRITIGVDALSTASARYRLRIHVDYDASFTANMPGVEGVSALPLLAGIRITDQSGAPYRVVSGHEANTTGDLTHLTSSLEFARNQAAPPTTITLHIASVLFADRQAFIATAAAARLVDGPWEFTITVRQPT